jgi:hypothetical protein
MKYIQKIYTKKSLLLKRKWKSKVKPVKLNLVTVNNSKLINI